MRKLLVGILLGFLLIVLLEGFSSTYVGIRTALAPGLQEWYQFSPDLGWERRPNFLGTVGDIGQFGRQFDAQGFFVSDSKQTRNTETRKIIALGDSITFGWGTPPESSFVEVLDRLLPNASVINMGVNGYTSYQGYKTLVKHGLHLKPDLIIVSFNYNDRRYVDSGDAIDSDHKFSQDSLLRERKNFSDKLNNMRLPIILSSVMRKAGLSGYTEVDNSGVFDDVRTLHARVSLKDYHDNLTKIAQLGKNSNIPVLFLLLKDNPAYTEHLRQGIELLEASQYDEAIRELKIAVNSRNEFSDLARKYLSLAYDKAGLVENAKNILRIERPLLSLHGGYPIYLDTEYNAIMRDVATKHNIRLVDAGSVLDKYPSTFLDMCHPDAEGHEKIAHLLYDTLKEMLPSLDAAP